MANDETELETEIQAKGLNAPRLNPKGIDAMIHSKHFVKGLELQHVATPLTKQSLGCLTLCVLVLKNGFTVVGKSACVSPENFDEVIGQKVAYAAAREQIWQLEGYRLRTQIADGTYKAPAEED